MDLLGDQNPLVVVFDHPADDADFAMLSWSAEVAAMIWFEWLRTIGKAATGWV